MTPNLANLMQINDLQKQKTSYKDGKNESHKNESIVSQPSNQGESYVIISEINSESLIIEKESENKNGSLLIEKEFDYEILLIEKESDDKNAGLFIEKQYENQSEKLSEILKKISEQTLFQEECEKSKFLELEKINLDIVQIQKSLASIIQEKDKEITYISEKCKKLEILNQSLQNILNNINDASENFKFDEISNRIYLKIAERADPFFLKNSLGSLAHQNFSRLYDENATLQKLIEEKSDEIINTINGLRVECNKNSKVNSFKENGVQTTSSYEKSLNQPKRPNSSVLTIASHENYISENGNHHSYNYEMKHTHHSKKNEIVCFDEKVNSAEEPIICVPVPSEYKTRLCNVPDCDKNSLVLEIEKLKKNEYFDKIMIGQLQSELESIIPSNYITIFKSLKERVDIQRLTIAELSTELKLCRERYEAEIQNAGKLQGLEKSNGGFASFAKYQFDMIQSNRFSGFISSNAGQMEMLEYRRRIAELQRKVKELSYSKQR